MHKSHRIVDEIVTHLQSYRSGMRVKQETLLLSELDLDSLQMLELISWLKLRFDVNFIAPPFEYNDLRTPLAIAEAITKKGGKENLP